MRCVAIAASFQRASNCWIKSPDDTTSTPSDRDQLDRAGVDARHVGDRAVRRVFHRHALQPVEQRGQARVQLRAARVNRLRSRQVIEVVALDGVHERPRLAGLRDQVEPAPRRQVSGVTHPGEPVRHRIRAVKIVEEPRVEPVGLEGLLDGSNIKGHIQRLYRRTNHGRGARRPIIEAAGRILKDVWKIL